MMFDMSRNSILLLLFDWCRTCISYNWCRNAVDLQRYPIDEIQGNEWQDKTWCCTDTMDHSTSKDSYHQHTCNFWDEFRLEMWAENNGFEVSNCGKQKDEKYGSEETSNYRHVFFTSQLLSVHLHRRKQENWQCWWQQKGRGRWSSHFCERIRCNRQLWTKITLETRQKPVSTSSKCGWMPPGDAGNIRIFLAPQRLLSAKSRITNLFAYIYTLGYSRQTTQALKTYTRFGWKLMIWCFP